MAAITRTVWQLHLYDNYSETRTVIRNVFLFNFASELANRTRLKELLRSSGLGRFTTQTTLLTLPVGENRSTRRKSTTVGKAFTNSSRKCHESEVGIEPTISEVTGACSDDCATWSLLCRTKQSYTRNLNSLVFHCNYFIKRLPNSFLGR